MAMRLQQHSMEISHPTLRRGGSTEYRLCINRQTGLMVGHRMICLRLSGVAEIRAIHSQRGLIRPQDGVRLGYGLGVCPVFWICLLQKRILELITSWYSDTHAWVRQLCGRVRKTSGLLL